MSNSTARLPILPLPLRKRLMTSYLANLGSRPLLTKSLTLALSYYIQSLLSTYIAMHGLGLGFEFFSLSNANKLKRVRVRLAELVNEGREKRSVLMAAYGALISGPMKHYLPIAMAHLSALLLPASASPKTAALSGLALGMGVQIPIECAVYVLSMGWIGGARGSAQLKGVLASSFGKMYKATLVIHPVAIIIAQKLLAPEYWHLFGVSVQFLLGTAAMTMLKTKRFRAIKKAGEDKKGEELVEKKDQ